MNKNSTSIKYGIMAGIIMILLLLLLYFFDKTKLASPFVSAIYLPLLFLMIWGGITVRREKGGFNGFGDAFLTVFIISITASIMFDTFGFVLYKVIDPELPAIIKEKKIQAATTMMEKFGTSDDKMNEALKTLQDRDFTPNINSQLMAYASSLIIGAIFSALIALFVNRSENEVPIKTEA